MRTLADSSIQTSLDEALESARPLIVTGKVPEQIPALARTAISKLGICVVLADGREYSAGDADEPFSVQSIAKLFNLAIALDWIGESIWTRVGREPSGMPYNSIVQLEVDGGIPRNPFMNSGAIVVMDALLSCAPTVEDDFRSLLRRLSGNSCVDFDQDIFSSEAQCGDINRAIAFYLKGRRNLAGVPLHVVNSYFRCCSITMSCRDLAWAMWRLMEDPCGSDRSPPEAYGPLLRLTSLMRTCGLYERSGEFAYRVGLPAKSGIGGGIVAINPGKFAACTWSPALDRSGNSIAGFHALERIVSMPCFTQEAIG